jgi:NADPH2:quinone reductase
MVFMTDASRATEPLPSTGRAVRFDHYGDIDVLRIQEVPIVSPGDDEVLVRVRAAGINPGEAAIRKGSLEAMFPTTFPSGEGTDFSGVVIAAGSAASAHPAGSEVLG